MTSLRSFLNLYPTLDTLHTSAYIIYPIRTQQIPLQRDGTYLCHIGIGTILGLTPKAVQQTIVAFPRDKRSYQEAMNRPISIISYDPPEYQVSARTYI